jgi:hypothetical protein
MIPQNLKIVELRNVDDEAVGLYLTQRDDTEQFQDDFDAVFQEAIEMEDNQDEDWDLRTYVDDKLSEEYNLHREWAEEVTVNII